MSKKCHHQTVGTCDRCRELHNEAVKRWRVRNGQSFYGIQHINDGSEYGEDEVEFMLAVEKYKREKRRPFPTSHEILAVAKSLGYRKVADESERTRETRRAEPRKRSLETACRDER